MEPEDNIIRLDMSNNFALPSENRIGHVYFCTGGVPVHASGTASIVEARSLRVARQGSRAPADATTAAFLQELLGGRQGCGLLVGPAASGPSVPVDGGRRGDERSPLSGSLVLGRPASGPSSCPNHEDDDERDGQKHQRVPAFQLSFVIPRSACKSLAQTLRRRPRGENAVRPSFGGHVRWAPGRGSGYWYSAAAGAKPQPVCGEAEKNPWNPWIPGVFPCARRGT